MIPQPRTGGCRAPERRSAAGAHVLEEAGLPCYPFPERAVAVLGGMALVADRRRSRRSVRTALPLAEAVTKLSALRASGRLRLGMLDLAPILSACGIAVAAPVAVKTAEETGAAAARLGFPVALKIVSPDISHKTEVGGVRLGLGSVESVVEAARGMRERAEAPAGIDRGLRRPADGAYGKGALVGSVRDPQFGPLVMVGFGGIYVEVLRDTAARLAPVDVDEALAMLEELRLARLLHGVRGEPGVHLLALAETIAPCSALVAEAPGLEELAVNPLVAGVRGAVAVDARAILAPSTA